MTDKETLEEAMVRLSNVVGAGGISDKHSFMLGTFWQRERSYSEEEAKQLAFDFYSEMSRAMKVPDYMITDSTILLERKFNQYKK